MKKQLILPILVFATLLFSTFGPTACVSKFGDTTIQLDSIDTTIQVSFSTEIVPVFEEKCAFSGCHVPGGKSPDLTADNAYNELTLGGYIDFDMPDESALVVSLVGGTMPPGGGEPDTSLIRKVRTWIKQGAKDN